MKIGNSQVVLRTFTENDIENKIRWINDPKNNAHLHYDIPLEKEKTLQWFKNKNNETRYDFIIEFDGVPVGLIGLLNIDKVNSKAEYYICLGENEYKGKGIAKEATRILIDFGFNQIDINKIYLNVDADNEVACHLYEKSGFTCEGVFIQDLLHNGKLIDRKRYAIIRSKKK